MHFQTEMAAADVWVPQKLMHFMAEAIGAFQTCLLRVWAKNFALSKERDGTCGYTSRDLPPFSGWDRLVIIATATYV